MNEDKKVRVVRPGEFEVENHFYPRVLNAQLHPVVRFFFNMDIKRLMTRYRHNHPNVKMEKLKEMLEYKPSYFRWAGADLFAVTTAKGYRQMMVLETNSCPSGQKSTPFIEEMDQGGYYSLMKKTFVPVLNSDYNFLDGGLAVIYDKNIMENSGYACALSDLMDEPVYLVKFKKDDPDPCVKFDDGIMFVKIDTESDDWLPIRAAFRYVTQSPWDRIPILTKTMIFNPIISCLAGGRNKLVASKAYDFLNSSLQNTGLGIKTPDTIWDVSKAEVPLWIRRMGGLAVVKNPYSNAGQGVWTITNKQDFEVFDNSEQKYSKFIVQKLIGNYGWYKRNLKDQVYHIGTVPDRHCNIFITDIRMMIHSTVDGYRPLATYARKARKPITPTIEENQSSWDIMGTNLSIKKDNGEWDTDTNRLVLMDARDFNRLGIGLDDLIESFIQTVLSAVAIDKMAKRLIDENRKFNLELFKSLDPDNKFIDEIRKATNFD